MLHEYNYDRISKVLGPKTQFVQGDVAVAYGALLAGCMFFAGYPITPATETAEKLSELIPKVGGRYIQMEDEIASMGAIIGASWTGTKSMTATSGPGFSLMMEHLGYAVMSETPCVVVNVQRSGPSTGQPTEGAQGDVLQAYWGTHGDHEIVSLAPATVQECLDLTIEAFNLSETYRVPVLVMTDGEVGHMREEITIPSRDELVLADRKAPTTPPERFVPFAADDSMVPEMPDFGTGYKVYITGLTHDEHGYPSTDDAGKHTKLVERLVDKVARNARQFARVEKDYEEGARVGLVSFGISARSAAGAVSLLREGGKKVSFLRLITLFPTPEWELAALAEQVDDILVPELNLGQLVHVVREAAGGHCRVHHLGKIGGELINPTELVERISSGF